MLIETRDCFQSDVTCLGFNRQTMTNEYSNLYQTWLTVHRFGSKRSYQNSDLKTYPGQASNQLENGVPQRRKKESLGWSANENGIRSMNELKFKFWLCRIETESTECEIEQNDTDLKEIEDEKQSVLQKSGKTWEAKNHGSKSLSREKHTCPRPPLLSGGAFSSLDLKSIAKKTKSDENPNGIATKTKTPKKTVLEAEKTQLLEDLVLFFQPNHPHLGGEVTHLRPSAAYCHEVSMHVRGNSSWKRRDLAIFRKLPTPHLVMAHSPSSRDCRWKCQRRCRSPSLSACVSSFKWFKKGRNSHCDSMSTLRSIPNSADYRPSSCRSEKFTATLSRLHGPLYETKPLVLDFHLPNLWDTNRGEHCNTKREALGKILCSTSSF